jgi:hypothetical protein
MPIEGDVDVDPGNDTGEWLDGDFADLTIAGTDLPQESERVVGERMEFSVQVENLGPAISRAGWLRFFMRPVELPEGPSMVDVVVFEVPSTCEYEHSSATTLQVECTLPRLFPSEPWSPGSFVVIAGSSGPVEVGFGIVAGPEVIDLNPENNEVVTAILVSEAPGG